MSKRRMIMLVLVIAMAAGFYFGTGNDSAKAPVPASEGKHDEAGEEEHGHGEEEKAEIEGTELSEESVGIAGIQVAEAAPGRIHESIRLTGRTTLNQNKTAEVTARFPGVVRQVKKGPGDLVNKGDILATVESNESLQVYSVRAPLTGVVLSRGTNVGDVAAEMPMFTITDMADIWAEFHIFPRDMDRVKVGQTVLIMSFEGEHKGQSVINTLLPVAEASSQTVVARVTLPNPEGLWRAGMTVRGDVVIAEREVAVAVKTEAVQRMEGKPVVFVQKGGRFEVRNVRIGASDDDWTEILSGLKAGELYVSENSFQIKADIGKAGAEHEH